MTPPPLFSLSEDLHSIINQLAVQLLVFILKVYIQTYLNFIYLCEILFPDFNPYIRFVFLCFFIMLFNPTLRLSGVRRSLDPTCKHQITFCKLILRYTPPPPPPPPAYNISRAKSQFPWHERMARICKPSLQVALLNKTLCQTWFQVRQSELNHVKKLIGK